MAEAEPRKGMPAVDIDQDTFRKRFLSHFYDPAFQAENDATARLADIAWNAYKDSRKAPRTLKAGPGYADPDYDLSIEWIAARDAIHSAAKAQADKSGPSRILIINGSPRSEHTCPGEMSKTFRLVQVAAEIFEEAPGFVYDQLDLSHLTAEYGRVIYPCKACFSTSPALCHWPCSCYPNHALDQVNDWMSEIYPMWVAAHGIMIVTPCHWYQAPTVLKSMIDRLVCADGGNPDPTSTHGKNAKEAKELELAGWPYPRHLAGRVFAIVVHGDSAGIESLRRNLTDWLTDMQLTPAGDTALLDRYIGYYKPYATSHADLDQDTAIVEEVRNAARTLVEAVRRYRAGEAQPGSKLADPRPK